MRRALPALAGLIALVALVAAGCAPGSAPPAETATPSAAQAIPALPEDAPAPQAEAEPLWIPESQLEADAGATQLVFWELNHPSRPGRLHLLGSIHRLQGADMGLDPAIERAWSAADALVVEMDLTAMDSEDRQLVVQQTGRLPSGTSLENRVEASTWSLLESTLSGYGSSAAAVKSYKPWFVALMVTEIELARSGFDPRNGIDHQFMQRARGRKPIEALESLDQQIRAFDDLPNHLQELMLRESLFLSGSHQMRVNRTVNAWRRGDLEDLELAIFSDLEDHPELRPFYDKIYSDRNLAWAERLDALFGGRALFVVVGAGHMVGDADLLDLLAKRGFRARRVPKSR